MSKDIVGRVGWQVGQMRYILANYTRLILQHQGPRHQKLESIATTALPSGTADMVRQTM